jgi:hypothetical protein
MGKHYINSEELEEWWQGWLITRDPHCWSEMSDRIYRICSGIATNFNPRDEEEHQEHVHDAWMHCMDKIQSGKLRFTAGKAPVFNLVTTTIFRILYSKMNKQKRQREHDKKYAQLFIQQNAPELLHSLDHESQSSSNS